MYNCLKVKLTIIVRIAIPRIPFSTDNQVSLVTKRFPPSLLDKISSLLSDKMKQDAILLLTSVPRLKKRG